MMSEELIKFIISRVIANANTGLEECDNNENDDFYAGRKFAYYEILDIIKSELTVHEQNLNDFGIDINFEDFFFNK